MHQLSLGVEIRAGDNLTIIPEIVWVSSELEDWHGEVMVGLAVRY